MGIDYDTTLFFGFMVSWDRVRAWILSDSNKQTGSSSKPGSSIDSENESSSENLDDDSSSEESEEDYAENCDLLDPYWGKGVVLGGKYKFELIQASPHYDCRWGDLNFAFGVERGSFSMDDMQALISYTTLEGYDKLHPILEALGVWDVRPRIIALLNVT